MAGRFDNNKLQDWDAQANNPAAPVGQQQAAQAAGGFQSGDQRFADSALGRMTAERGYVNQARSWYTGANAEGTNNGWDNAFANKFFDQQERAAKNGTMGRFFDQPDSTGVVTWDHKSEDERTDYKFGDVYEDGQKVANVYDQFDKGTADLMMADFLFDRTTKTRIFGSSDREERLAREVADKREQNNINIPKALSAADFNTEVKDRAESFDEAGGGALDETLIGAAGATGAATVIGGAVAAGGTAAASTFWSGPGALIAGGLAAVGGGAFALMNQDELREQAARAFEITALSREEFGLGAATATGVAQWSGVAGKYLAPLGNMTHGGAELLAGDIGDRESAFYSTDSKGDRVIPNWLKVADVGAAVGDGMLQFASPVGVAAYTAQMSGHIAGSVGEITLTGGSTFNDRQGGFDNTFVDDDGEFDPLSAAAGVGVIGIDAVQLGMVRGLAGKVNAANQAVGREAVFGKVFEGGRVSSRLPKWMGGQSDAAAAKAALAAGGSQRAEGAFTYTLDATGKAVSRRANLQVLAPSEQLSALSTRVMAKRAKAVDGGALKADDFYRAATQLATGEKRWNTALVNAMGEGYEEAMQAVLEPLSHNARLDFTDIGESALYGFAGGLGMGLALNLQSPGTGARLEAKARTGYEQLNGPVDDKTWNDHYSSLSDYQKRQAASLSNVQEMMNEAAFDVIRQEQAYEAVAGVAGISKVNDAIQDALAKDLAKAQTRTDGAFVIVGHEEAATLPSNAVGASLLQTAANITSHGRGKQAALGQLNAEVAELDAQVKADPSNLELAEKYAQKLAQVQGVELEIGWSQRVDQELDRVLRVLAQPTTTAEQLQAEVAGVNAFLQSAFDREISEYGGELLDQASKDALARSVSLLFARDPHADSGSYHLLMPQVSAKLTAENSHDMLQVAPGILTAIRGDHDGDKMRQLNQVILNDADFVRLREGSNLLGAGESVNVGGTKYEKYHVEFLAESFSPHGTTALKSVAEQTLQDIAAAIRQRYSGQGIDRELDEVLDRFFQAVKGNNAKAREVLLDGLAKTAGGPISQFGSQNWSNEWLWLDTLIRANFDRFQQAYAARRPMLAEEPTGLAAPAVDQEPAIKERRALAAATPGVTISLRAAGDSLFRMFQHLHYTALAAPVLSAERLEPMPLTEQAQLYEALGAGITTSEIEAIRAKDEITARVVVQLQRMVAEARKQWPNLSQGDALVLVANLEVQDFDIHTTSQGSEIRSNGKTISMAQMLLKRSVNRDRQEKDLVWDASPELQAKHARLRGMTTPGGARGINAERTFIEVFGAQQLYTILGDEAGIFGPHLTVEQWLRMYADKGEVERRNTARKLQGEAPYLGRKQSKSMPYKLTEMEDISAYRAVVDALLTVGNHRLALDDQGRLTGEYADRNAEVSATLRTAFANVRVAVQRYLELPGARRRDNETELQAVQRLFESNPEAARQVMNLIPNASVNAVFEARDGELFVSNWIYEMFTISDPKQAEMYYWRNLLLAEWNALGGPILVDEDVTDEGAKGRRYSRLGRRMHRVMYHLASQNDNGLLLKQFTDRLTESTDLDEFLRWVNTTPGVRGEQAPLLAWFDDTADFDADKTGGGWTQSLPMAELREAFTVLREGSANLVESLNEEAAAIKSDQPVLAALTRVIAYDRGESTELEAGDRALYDQMQKSIELAVKQVQAFGPQAMLHQSTLAVWGTYAHAHTKGLAAASVEANGAFEAQRDALDYVTNYERVMASLTAVNLDAVGGNLTQVSKDAGVTMDDEGRMVRWGEPSVEQMVELLSSATTRPMARAMLFPQVLERTLNGAVRPQMLVGKSLKSFLSGSSYNELFATESGSLSDDKAFRYLSLVEAQARKHGGHFSVQRAANDLTMARTSALNHAASFEEIEQLTVQSYRDIARVLQSTGSVAAAKFGPDEVHPLTRLMSGVREARRAAAVRERVNPDFADETGQKYLELQLIELEKEYELDKQTLLREKKSAKGKAGKALLQSKLDARKRQLDTAKERFKLMFADDAVQQVVQMFNDPANERASQDAILKYFQSNMHSLERMSASRITVSKMTTQMLDRSNNGTIRMEDAEWEELGAAVIGAYLDDVFSIRGVTAGATVSVPPFPGEDTGNRRYYDHTFAYLADGLLDPNNPMVKAAAEVYLNAGRLPERAATDEDLLGLLDRTIFKEFTLGIWTSDIPRSSIEMNERLDSSAAGVAIAMAGNSPKRQAVLSAALRRSYERPDESMLSSATLSMQGGLADTASDFDEVEVRLPGQAGSVRRPLAQMNNRFAHSVKLRGVDRNGAPFQVELLDVAPGPDLERPLNRLKDLGRRWPREESVAESGYFEIHLDRVRKAVELEVQARGGDRATAVVDIDFFHPDSQPADGSWANNVYFEGTSFKLDADRHRSLVETLWFANESISPAAQAQALDAAKLGLPALQVVDTVSSAEREGMEANYLTDLGAVLRAKTKTLLTRDFGNGSLDVEFFNAVYKDMKIRHWVVGTLDGQATLWSAEQVIAHQLNNPGTTLPLDNPMLWTPSDDVLRSMLGEIGTQGALGFSDDLEVNISRVPQYQGVTEQMLEMFAPGIAGEVRTLDQTRIANRGREGQLQVRTFMDQAARGAFDTRIRFFQELKQDIWEDRAMHAPRAGEGGFQPSTSFNEAVAEAETMLRAENLSLDWSKIGAFWIGPRDSSNADLARIAMQSYNSAVDPGQGSRAGWIYREGVEASSINQLNEVTLGESRKGPMRIAPGDMVVVHLDTIKDEKTMKRRLDHFANQGAVIVLGEGGGGTDLRAEAAAYMETLPYESVFGVKNLYAPVTSVSRYQNVRARESTLTEMRAINTPNFITVFQALGIPVQEGTAWVNPKNERLRSVRASLDLVPADAFGGFNVPVESQVQDVRAQLRGLDTEAGRALLREQSNERIDDVDQRAEADIDFDRAWSALMNRFDAHDGVVLPQPGDEFGTGDIVPLIGPDGRSIILYRHGHYAPDARQLETMLAQTQQGAQGAANVAVYSGQRNSAATTHSGKVASFTGRPKHGLQVELHIDLQVFGDKKVLEWNGMKYILNEMPDSVDFDHQLFSNGRGIDLASDADTAISKGGHEGVINNHRNAFTYFGVNFLEDLTEFFYPGQGKDTTAQRNTEQKLAALSRSSELTIADADEIMSLGQAPNVLESLLQSSTQLSPELFTDAGDWAERLGDPASAQSQIAFAVIVYSMVQGTSYKDVIRSGGFNSEDVSNPDLRARRMPQLFTQFFDKAPLGSDLRRTLNDRFNSTFARTNDGRKVRIRQDFMVELTSPDPQKNAVGWLQFAEAHSSGDNPITNGQAFDPNAKQKYSRHSADMAYQAIGAETVLGYDIGKAQRFAKGDGVFKDLEGANVWRMLTDIPAGDQTFAAWRAQSPLEVQQREWSREGMIGYRQGIVREADNGWTGPNEAKAKLLATRIVEQYGLQAVQWELVDLWARQWLGMPSGINQEGNTLKEPSYQDFMAAAEQILLNAQDGLYPTTGGELQLTHLHDVQMLRRANRNNPRGWAPRMSMDPDSPRANSWEEWVDVAIGSVMMSEQLFDRMFLVPMDGFMHTYQNATRSLVDLPVSMDRIKSLQLIDVENNKLLTSIDPNTEQLIAEPMQLEVTRASIDDLLGGQRIDGRFAHNLPSAAILSQRRAARVKWRKEHNTPFPVEQSVRDLHKNGSRFRQHSTTTNALARILINLRVGTALINPALWISAGPEMWVRGALDQAANLLTGDATAGLTARAQSRATERLAGTRTGELLEQLGLSATYTPEQLARLGTLNSDLGTRPEFKGMVNAELWYKRPFEPGQRTIEKAFEAYAKFGSRMQDPTFGMRAKTLARRYTESALAHIMRTPGYRNVSVDTLISALSSDPTYLKNNFPDAHAAAIATITQVRSLKPTPWSLALRGVYEPLSESSNSLVNFSGNVLLKMPMLFSTYAMNVATTLTGMQGLSDMTAMFVDGREKPKFIRRMQAAMRGEEFDPNKSEPFDMSEVIEGIDLTRSFIRGGMTHTGIFTMGLLAGGLGLSGEDEEERRLRRAAELQGAFYAYDPRRMENDFRNRDALFLEWLPFGLDSWFRVGQDSSGEQRSMAQMHWMMKQFVSPVLGMERFFNTGDWRHVGWGFEEALGSFPLINSGMWADASETAAELAGMASDEAKLGGPENLPTAAGFLATAVGVYEKMLFENSFVNALYTGTDRYDRDPYALPMRDSDGTIQRDAMGNPRQTGALNSYINEDEELKQGYLGRDSFSARMHSLTENRASLAVAMSLFNGLGTSSYLRKNMVVKTRELEKDAVTQEEAEALVVAAVAGAGDQPALDAGEIANILKNDAKAAGVWYDQAEVEAQAQQLAAGQQGVALSVLDDQGREILTADGAQGIFRGLLKGSVKLGDASLAGVHIPFEMRETIQKEWMEDIIQEGVDWGLTQAQATSRMKRVWYGPITDPEAVGLGDILWSKDISYSDKITYNQLNTTYVMGPDGLPWATGFTRDGVAGALGVKPLNRAIISKVSEDGSLPAISQDGRLNSVDNINTRNTGLRALELTDESWLIPTDEEIGKSIEKAIEEAASKDFAPNNAYTPGGGGGGGGYRGYGRRSYGRGGGGGGYSSSGYASFVRMNDLPMGRSPYGERLPFINTSNPIIRRANVRRERVWSERGRLNQWQ